MRIFARAAAMLAISTLFGVGMAHAQPFTAYDNASGILTLQNYGGALGLDFHVNSTVNITALGAFDNGVTANLNGKDGTSGIYVGIFTLSGVQVGTTVHFTSSTPGVTQLNGDAFLAVSFSLLPGDYSIVATNDRNYNTSGAANTTATTNTGGGLISFIGNARYSPSATLALPSTLDHGPADRYDAGTFQFTAVPEPASALLLGAGLAGFGVVRRRRAARRRTA